MNRLRTLSSLCVPAWMLAISLSGCSTHHVSIDGAYGSVDWDYQKAARSQTNHVLLRFGRHKTSRFSSAFSHNDLVLDLDYSSNTGLLLSRAIGEGGHEHIQVDCLTFVEVKKADRSELAIQAKTFIRLPCAVNELLSNYSGDLQEFKIVIDSPDPAGKQSQEIQAAQSLLVNIRNTISDAIHEPQTLLSMMMVEDLTDQRRKQIVEVLDTKYHQLGVDLREAGSVNSICAR